jgi:hypothetical protein
MRRFAGLFVTAGVLLVASFVAARPGVADVVVTIDRSAQRMSVAVNGQARYYWPVSTGRAGYGTPGGVYRPQMMARSWFSKKYSIRRCPTRSSFTGAMRSTARTTFRGSAGPLRTVACDCTPPTRRRFSRWSGARGPVGRVDLSCERRVARRDSSRHAREGACFSNANARQCPDCGVKPSRRWPASPRAKRADPRDRSGSAA